MPSWIFRTHSQSFVVTKGVKECRQIWRSLSTSRNSQNAMAEYSSKRGPRARKRYIIETSSDEDSDSEDALAVQSELISRRKSPQFREVSGSQSVINLPLNAKHPALEDVATEKLRHVDGNTGLCEDLDDIPRIAISAVYANPAAVYSAVVFDLINYGAPYAPIKQFCRLGSAIYRCDGPGCLFSCKARPTIGGILAVVEASKCSSMEAPAAHFLVRQYQPTHSQACKEQASRQRILQTSTFAASHMSSTSKSTMELIQAPLREVSYSSRHDLYTATKHVSQQSAGLRHRLQSITEKTTMRIFCSRRKTGCPFAVRASISGNTGRVYVVKVNDDIQQASDG